MSILLEQLPQTESYIDLTDVHEPQARVRPLKVTLDAENMMPSGISWEELAEKLATVEDSTLVFDVDQTIYDGVTEGLPGTLPNYVRAGTLELFQSLKGNGNQCYLWSRSGKEHAEAIAKLVGLTGNSGEDLVAGCYSKPFVVDITAAVATEVLGFEPDISIDNDPRDHIKDGYTLNIEVQDFTMRRSGE